METNCTLSSEQSHDSEFRSAISETSEVFTPSPPSVGNRVSEDHEVLDEFSAFRRGDGKTISRSLLLRFGSPEASFAQDPSLNLETKLLSTDIGEKLCLKGNVQSKADVKPVQDYTAGTVKTFEAIQQAHSHDFQTMDLESSLLKVVCDDNARDFVVLMHKINRLLKMDEAEARTPAAQVKMYQYVESIFGYWFPHRLLSFACQMDSAACAKALLEGQTGLFMSVNIVDERGNTPLHHAAQKLSVNCIKLLLQKHAKTELLSKDGFTPLQVALLHNKRWQKDWQTLPAIDVIRIFRAQDLTAIKVLAEHTKDVLNLAVDMVIVGNSNAVTALLLAGGKQISIDQHYGYETFVGMILDRIFPITKGNSSNNNSANEKELENKWMFILKSLEIVVLLKGELRGSASHTANGKQRKVVHPLLRAVQAGEETIINVLLKDTDSVHETDIGGNTALHWCLRSSVPDKRLRIAWHLLRHGSVVSARNALGLTPVHIAAEEGHIQTLQLLLAQDPEAVHIIAETRETPLFLAVKNNNVDCAKLLLQFGSNTQTLNLRRQRPIDLANSEDMRTLLSQTGRYRAGRELRLPTQPGDKSLEDETQIMDIYCLYKNGQNKDLHANAKTVLCRYYKQPGGCVRGDACFFAHGEKELRQTDNLIKIYDSNNNKIFVGGLPPTMGSDELKETFQNEFGPVTEATVMGNQVGDIIQSRGFGFVTFKNKSQYLEAVKKRFITVSGKLVEIKAAMQFSNRMEEEMLHTFGPTFKSGCQAKSEEQNTNMTTKSDSQAKTAKQNARWLTVFKQWFPSFLKEAVRRHAGNWYPLSSVKADFRATCGMELDHAAVGYPKLSDFLRSMPELCRMKIVPVGKGPATHVVLQLHQKKKMTKLAAISNPSLVHEGRTYADVAGCIETTPDYSSHSESRNEEEEFIVPGTQPVSQNEDPDVDDDEFFRYIFSRMPIQNCIEDEIPPRREGNTQKEEMFTSLNTAKEFKIPSQEESETGSVVNKMLTFDSSQISGTQKLSRNGQQQESCTSSTSFLNLDDKTEWQAASIYAWSQFATRNKTTSTREKQNFTESKKLTVSQITKAQQHSQVPLTKSEIQNFAHAKADCQANSIQSYGNPYRELSGHGDQDIPLSRKSMQSLFSDYTACSSYNPWNSDSFQGCKRLIQQMNMAVINEDSPQSTITSDSLDSPTPSAGRSPSHKCTVCTKNIASWTALPCAHKVICTVCKDWLHKKHQTLQQCTVCHVRAHQLVSDGLW